MRTSNPKMMFQGLVPRGGSCHITVMGIPVVSLWGSKLQILVSIRVFGMESHFICQFKYRLILYKKKYTKKVLTLTTQKSPLGVSLSLSHTHTGLP